VLLTAPPGDGYDPTHVRGETAEVPAGHTPVPAD
jgi:hypothetical protein